MLRRLVLLTAVIIIMQTAWRQDPNAKAWERRNTTVRADSILAAIERGEDVIIDKREILDTLAIVAWERPKTGWITLNDVWSLIKITNSVFRGPVSFSSCYFRKDIFLGGNAFFQDADFSTSTFSGVVDFNNTEFRMYTSFFRVVFEGHAHFLHTTFDTNVNFSLERFSSLYYLTWEQLNNRLLYDAYLTHSIHRLTRYFEERRQLDDADGVYLFLKEEERVRKPWWTRYPEYWLIQQASGYGVKPWRPLRASLVVVALLAILYYSITIREPKRALGTGLRRIVVKAYNAIYFSINTFLIGAPLDWAPENSQSSTKHYLFRIPTTVEKTLGWILLVLFVVTLTRKFIR